MAKETIDVRCPRCGNEWSADLGEVEAVEVNYRQRGRMSQYRLACPECGSRWRMTVAEEEPEEAPDAAPDAAPEGEEEE